MYVIHVFTSGFKRGADPGMPEPTIWRYVLVPNVHTNAVQIVNGLGVNLWPATVVDDASIPCF